MRVMIIGGTSGIGLALAIRYLQHGATVAICGRDLQRLPHELGASYPQLQTYQLDIADKAALAQAINDFGENGLDLLIVSAGVYYNTRHQQLDAAETLHMLRTNVSGLNHAFELAAEKMLQQNAGHLVAIASVAGLLRDYPGASLYSASKRSVLNLCDTYRMALRPFSITVTSIVPGYMDTARLRALNAGDASHKPFIMPEAQAVRHITTAIAQRREVAVFPWQMRWLIGVLNWLPSRLLALRR